jgi:hypothetical protein
MGAGGGGGSATGGGEGSMGGGSVGGGSTGGGSTGGGSTGGGSTGGGSAGGGSAGGGSTGGGGATAPCDTGLSGSTAADYAKALGLCNAVSGASFVTGQSTARAIRARFGDDFTPREGASMVLLSTGLAKDNHDDPNYNPQPGTTFGTTSTHPLWAALPCGPSTAVTTAQDMTELDIDLQAPPSAHGFSFDFAFFSSEYPEFMCTEFNDRFLVLLQSSSSPPVASNFPSNQCTTSMPLACNLSFDSSSQPVTISNTFFDLCDSFTGANATGTMVTKTCVQPSSMLTMTGYDRIDNDMLSTTNGLKVGGGTGWRTTTMSVTPGQTFTVRFIVLEEGDGQYDSAALIDNFRWLTASSSYVQTQ